MPKHKSLQEYPDLHLREYQPSDHDAVWQLHVDGLNQTGTFVYNPNIDDDFKNISRIYLNGTGTFLVVLSDDQIIGMGALKQIDTQTAEVKRMRVHINHQNKGIGSFILQKLLEKAKDLGYQKLILDTATSQTAAQKLYEKWGFQQFQKKENTLFYERAI